MSRSSTVRLVGPRVAPATTTPRDLVVMPPPGVVPHALTREDLEILCLIARGLPMETVARRLSISDRTVRRRCRQACDRLGVDTPIEAVVWAARRHLV